MITFNRKLVFEVHGTEEYNKLLSTLKKYEVEYYLTELGNDYIIETYSLLSPECLDELSDIACECYKNKSIKFLATNMCEFRQDFANLQKYIRGIKYLFEAETYEVEFYSSLPAEEYKRLMLSNYAFAFSHEQ